MFTQTQQMLDILEKHVTAQVDWRHRRGSRLCSVTRAPCRALAPKLAEQPPSPSLRDQRTTKVFLASPLLQGYTYHRMDGGTGVAQRARLMDDFNSNPDGGRGAAWVQGLGEP